MDNKAQKMPIQQIDFLRLVQPLRDQNIFIDEIISVSQGSNKQVYKCKNSKTNQSLIIKVATGEGCVDLKNEYKNSQKIKFPSLRLIKVDKLFQLQVEGIKVYVGVSDKVGEQSLKAINENGEEPSLQNAQQILFDCLFGILECSLSNFYHLDIKPENIVKLNNAYYLIDFSSSGTEQCTTYYYCPENYKNEKYKRYDIYSLGITLLQYLKIKFDKIGDSIIVKDVEREEFKTLVNYIKFYMLGSHYYQRQTELALIKIFCKQFNLDLTSYQKQLFKIMQEGQLTQKQRAIVNVLLHVMNKESINLNHPYNLLEAEALLYNECYINSYYRYFTIQEIAEFYYSKNNLKLCQQFLKKLKSLQKIQAKKENKLLYLKIDYFKLLFEVFYKKNNIEKCFEYFDKTLQLTQQLEEEHPERLNLLFTKSDCFIQNYSDENIRLIIRKYNKNTNNYYYQNQTSCDLNYPTNYNFKYLLEKQVNEEEKNQEYLKAEDTLLDLLKINQNLYGQANFNVAKVYEKLSKNVELQKLKENPQDYQSQKDLVFKRIDNFKKRLDLECYQSELNEQIQLCDKEILQAEQVEKNIYLKQYFECIKNLLINQKQKNQLEQIFISKQKILAIQQNQIITFNQNSIISCLKLKSNSISMQMSRKTISQAALSNSEEQNSRIVSFMGKSNITNAQMFSKQVSQVALGKSFEYMKNLLIDQSKNNLEQTSISKQKILAIQQNQRIISNQNSTISCLKLKSNSINMQMSRTFSQECIRNSEEQNSRNNLFMGKSNFISIQMLTKLINQADLGIPFEQMRNLPIDLIQDNNLEQIFISTQQIITTQQYQRVLSKMLSFIQYFELNNDMISIQISRKPISLATLGKTEEYKLEIIILVEQSNIISIEILNKPIKQASFGKSSEQNSIIIQFIIKNQNIYFEDIQHSQQKQNLSQEKIFSQSFPFEMVNLNQNRNSPNDLVDSDKYQYSQMVENQQYHTQIWQQRTKEAFQQQKYKFIFEKYPKIGEYLNVQRQDLYQKQTSQFKFSRRANNIYYQLSQKQITTEASKQYKNQFNFQKYPHNDTNFQIHIDILNEQFAKPQLRFEKIKQIYSDNAQQTLNDTNTQSSKNVLVYGSNCESIIQFSVIQQQNQNSSILISRQISLIRIKDNKINKNIKQLNAKKIGIPTQQQEEQNMPQDNQLNDDYQINYFNFQNGLNQSDIYSTVDTAQTQSLKGSENECLEQNYLNFSSDSQSSNFEKEEQGISCKKDNQFNQDQLIVVDLNLKEYKRNNTLNNNQQTHSSKSTLKNCLDFKKDNQNICLEQEQHENCYTHCVTQSQPVLNYTKKKEYEKNMPQNNNNIRHQSKKKRYYDLNCCQHTQSFNFYQEQQQRWFTKQAYQQNFFSKQLSQDQPDLNYKSIYVQKRMIPQQNISENYYKSNKFNLLEYNDLNFSCGKYNFDFEQEQFQPTFTSYDQDNPPLESNEDDDDNQYLVTLNIKNCFFFAQNYEFIEEAHQYHAYTTFLRYQQPF